MEDTFSYCLGCLYPKDCKPMRLHKFRNEFMKSIMQMEFLYLCNICKRLAQKCEQFLQNVQTNNIYLENLKDIWTHKFSGKLYCRKWVKFELQDSLTQLQLKLIKITDLSVEKHRVQLRPMVNLSTIFLHKIELNDNNEDIDEPVSIVYSSNIIKNSTVKLELKEEEALGEFDGDYVDNSDFHESLIKDEDNCSLKILIKDENNDTLDEINLKLLKKTLKKCKQKKLKKAVTYYESDVLENKDCEIKVIHITREQCLKERVKMIEDPKYKNCVYKCEDCIQGFNLKETFDKHMEKHSKAMGEFECDICKRRMKSMDKLLNHQRYHKLRYKCVECGLTRINRLTIKDHYTAFHLHEAFQHKCAHCNKMFKRQVSLRKHVSYAHRNKKRAKCKFCMRTYANPEGLKAHVMRKHASEVSSHPLNKHACAECGAAFKAPSQLKYHMIKHSLRRDFYCVECDRGFKSDGALKQHLKTTSPHVNYLELPLKCLYCAKRFGIKRDLERHMNRVHLDNKPYQCDTCDKAYVNMWSLREHKLYTHEGKKRPLKYPCPMCDKIFDRNATRKSHIRTHTGEKPYMCSKCPAKFSQASILGTHVKLVHLKLTRDGRPKQAPLAVK